MSLVQSWYSCTAWDRRHLESSKTSCAGTVHDSGRSSRSPARRISAMPRQSSRTPDEGSADPLPGNLATVAGSGGGLKHIDRHPAFTPTTRAAPQPAAGVVFGETSSRSPTCVGNSVVSYRVVRTAVPDDADRCRAGTHPDPC